MWVTFDDGLPSVVESGLPLLREFGVPATLFVCPGVVNSGEPYWWDAVATAVEHGLAVPGVATGANRSAVSALKSVADATRREVCAQLTAALQARGIPIPSAQLTLADLQRWQECGYDIGNHTWDHPCLDCCEKGSQREQIQTADLWLQENFDPDLRIFAYPNGDWTVDAERVLGDLRYDLALLFDHRLATTKEHPYRVSRLRVSTDASDGRFAAILSGAHSSAYHASRGFRGSALDTGLRSLPEGARDVPPSARAAIASSAARTELMPCEQLLFDTYVHDGASVLDLGVGSGRTIPALSQVSGTYVGIDPSRSTVDACRTNNPGVDIRVLDASDLHALANGSFDVVVFSSNGLDYLYPYERRARCIEEIKRVIRPAGTVIVSSHNARSLFRPWPLVSPAPKTLWRRRAIQVDASVRHATRTLQSRAFWTGDGYVHEVATAHTRYATTPNRLVNEFCRQGFVFLESVGASFPASTSSYVEPWYYFTFRRERYSVADSDLRHG